LRDRRSREGRKEKRIPEHSAIKGVQESVEKRQLGSFIVLSQKNK
jgi:hypothetical protein